MTGWLSDSSDILSLFRDRLFIYSYQLTKNDLHSFNLKLSISKNGFL